MNKTLHLSCLAFLLAATPSACFALWAIAPVSPAEAKKLGVAVRVAAAGEKHVVCEIEIDLEGTLKGFSHADVRIGETNDQIVVGLREDRSKKGISVMRFSSPRDQIGKISVWVMVPGSAGGTAWEIRAKEFVDLEKLK